MSIARVSFSRKALGIHRDAFRFRSEAFDDATDHQRCYRPSTVSKSAAAPGLRIWGGGHLRRKLIFLGGQDRIFKKVLLFAHAVVTGLSPPPGDSLPSQKGGDNPRNTRCGLFK